MTALPWIGCGRCPECRSNPEAASACPRCRMLGVDLDGAFAGEIVLPERTVYRLPEGCSFRLGAYVEPVAASLAVLRAGLDRQGKGLLFGDNRIALLTYRVLLASGFRDVTLFDPEQSPEELPVNGFDYAIETVAAPETLQTLLRVVRPRGRIVLKSRPARPVPLDIKTAVLKDLQFHAVNYGPFPDAIALLTDGRLPVEDLLGPVHPLDAGPEVLLRCGRDESAKQFLSPVPDQVD